jgi:hypothetical protein
MDPAADKRMDMYHTIHLKSVGTIIDLPVEDDKNEPESVSAGEKRRKSPNVRNNTKKT